MLDANLKAQLAGYLDRLVRPIVITAYTDDTSKGRSMEELLYDIAALSERITVVAGDPAGRRIPSFSLGSPGHEIDLSFAGLPVGHEFTSLVLALLQVGGYPPKAEQAVLDQIAALDGDFRFETYFSLSCQNCPDVVQAINLMAVLNPRVSQVAIDGALFREEVESREIMSVPTVLLNGQHFASGRMGVEEIVGKLDASAAGRDLARLSAQKPFDVLVLGAGPAGAAAAIYAARKGLRTGVVADRIGGQVLDTLAIENFVSMRHTEGPQLANALEAHIRDYDVQLFLMQRAQGLESTDHGYRIALESGASLDARAIVLATGARWRKLGVQGEDQYLNRGVAFCPHCDGPLFKGKRVAVIGGGNSGVEAAIDLAGLANHVTLIEFDHQLRADDVLQRKLRSMPNVSIVTAARTMEILGDGTKVTGLTYESRITGAPEDFGVDGIFVQIGLMPNTDWLKDAVKLSPRGEVIVNEYGETSQSGVFAAGDCTNTPYKQIIIAAGEGAKSALSAFDHLIRADVELNDEAA